MGERAALIVWWVGGLAALSANCLVVLRSYVLPICTSAPVDGINVDNGVERLW
jgi:hypothetical protein